MWCHSTAVPRSLASPGSSSHELFLSFRVRAVPILPCTFPCRAPSLGFRSPSRYQYAESTTERASHVSPYRSVLGVSHALDGLLLCAPCRFISPHNHVRDSPSRGYLPLPSHDRLVGGQSPLDVHRPVPAAELPRRLQPGPTHLQGLDPCSDSKPPTE